MQHLLHAENFEHSCCVDIYDILRVRSEICVEIFCRYWKQAQ